MIKNLWKHIDVVCGNHGEDTSVKMGWKTGHRSMFYSCPKYYPDARESGERACCNNVSVEDFEKIVDSLSDELSAMMKMGNPTPNLTNYSFKLKSIVIKVLSHTDDSIVISILNKKALQ